MRVHTQITAGIVGCCVLAAASTLAVAQMGAAAKPAVGTPVAPAKVYGKLLSQMEEEFVSAAEAMLEDNYHFAPSTSMGE